MRKCLTRSTKDSNDWQDLHLVQVIKDTFLTENESHSGATNTEKNLVNWPLQNARFVSRMKTKGISATGLPESPVTGGDAAPAVTLLDEFFVIVMADIGMSFFFR